MNKAAVYESYETELIGLEMELRFRTIGKREFNRRKKELEIKFKKGAK